MSLWAVAAAAALFVLLGLLGSRFASALASPADGLLYRGVIYTMAGAVTLHLVLTLLDFAGVRWSLPVLAVGLVLIAGVAGIATSFDAPGSAPAQDPHSPSPSLPSSPPPAGREGSRKPNKGGIVLGCSPSSPGGRGGGWEKRAGVMRVLGGGAPRHVKFAPRGLGGEGLGRGEFAWGDALALFALAVFTAFALSGWIAMPDYVYHWGFKGYRFYLAGGVDYTFLAHGWNWAIHPDYPNLVPEMFAVTALLAGSFEMPAMMLGTAVLFAFFVAACREGLRQGGAPPFVRQAGTALVALSSAAFGIGYIMAGAADWNLALALAAALPPLLRPPDRTGDYQIAVIAAFAAASKIEGVPLAAFLVAIQVFRHAWSEWTERRLSLGAAPGAVVAAGLLPAAVVMPWLGRAAHHHLFQAFNSGAFGVARAGEVFAGVGEALQLPAWHGFLPVMFLPPLLLVPRRTRAFAAAATLELLFYFYVYFTTPVANYRYFVLSNFPRLGFQLVPACMVAALVAWGAAKSERPAGSFPPAAAPKEPA